ncbi:hypothetical protein [Roseomonas sp. BN140053]|uniref:hypothetical protein n=1 Tax=Roseomonas sp. BN140053 TaxID=3391898 RepID=UPI0039ED9956
MRETHSRLLLAAEMLPALPCAVLMLTMTVPAAVMLTPIALFSLGAMLVQGRPKLFQDLWTGGGVLLMALLAACTVVAVCCLLALAVTFLADGRAGLRRRARLVRIGVFSALPPLLLWTLPRVAQDLLAAPLDADRVLAGLVYSGVPLLLPAAHLLLEARRRPAA